MCVPDMDDEDFTAADMCCTCDGGHPDCKDMDFSSTDANGNKCKDYTYEMCDDMADDDDFTASLMCCVCGQVTTTRTATSTTTTAAPVVVTTLPVEQDPPLGGNVWWFLLLLIPCMLCFFVPMYCYYRRDIPDLPDPELEKHHSDGFIINTTNTTSTSRQANATSTSFETSTSRHAQQATTIVVRDDLSEATVYGTACDLFVRPDLSKADIAGVDDSCVMCCSPLAPIPRGPPGGKVPLDGPWHVNGNPNIVATITGLVVVIDGDRGQQECGLKILEAERIALEVDGMVIQGQLVGNRLIWENGQMWRRAYASGSPGVLVPSMPVLGGATSGGTYAGGGYTTQGAYAAGGHSAQTYGYGGAAGGAYGGGGYGIDTREIMLHDSRVPGETRLAVGQGAPRALHMGR